MTVLPCPSESLRYNLALQELFSNTHQQVQQTQFPQILSFSQTLDKPFNLRAILQAQLHKNQYYCYWENPQHHTAVLGLGQVVQATLRPENRFKQAQQLAQQWFARVHQGGAVQSPYAGAYCFAAFTFFAQSGQESAIFAPGTLFIPQLQLVSRPEGGLWVGNLLIEPHSTLETTVANLAVLEQHVQGFQSSRTVDHSPTQSQPLIVPFSPHHPFIQAVQSALEAIDQQQLSKIVLAHAVDSVQPQPIPLGQTLSQLRHTHPDCYVFAFGNGSGHHFVGASPERLIAIHDQQLTTDALAGSAPRGGSPERDRAIAQYLLASEKEGREHQAVSDYIVQRLLALGLQPQCLSRRLRRLSNIQHLWTPITAPLPVNFHPLQVVGQLHPTPAVAGMPANIACAKIRQYETFDRALYAAPLGWLNAQGESEFIVGIRSALIRDNWVRLYGGAGIVSGSDPERELAEIQLKLQTMRQAIV